MKDDFYIGWESKAPPGVSRFLRRILLALLPVVLLVPITLALAQHLIAASVFEWGDYKTVSGVLQTRPCPHLLVPRPGDTGDLSPFSSYYLVAPWKFGLKAAAVTPFDGKWVTLQGTLIYRDNQTLIEVRPGTIQAKEEAWRPGPTASVPLGRQTLVGEIVDSKCFLGVMNPGQLTPHRACAIRCISGGCPPLFVVQPAGGPLQYFLLAAADGKPVNQAVLDLVAEPVEITGEVRRQGDLMILQADPATYKRFP
jgi:hypothetical protein